MRTILAGTLVTVIALGFAGCSRQLPATQTSQPSTVDATPTVKVGQTSKTGSVSKLNNKFYLQQTSQPLLEIDSYSVDLSTYDGKTVTVTGEYSGNTLFVGKVE